MTRTPAWRRPGRRRPRWRRTAAAAWLLAAFTLALAQPDLAPRALEASELDAATVRSAALRYELDAIAFDALATTGVPGLVVAVALDGEVLMAEAYGTADHGTGRPIALDDPLWLASVTKTAMALATLALSEAGLLDLDAPIDALLPAGTVPAPPGARPEPVDALLPATSAPTGPIADPNPITVRHLLSHTSGLDERLLNTVAPAGSPSAPLAALGLPPRVEPAGGAPRYGNAGHHALGLVIEAVTGQDLETALASLVFEPLGLDSARLFVPADSGYEAATVRGHQLGPSGELRTVGMPTLRDPGAGGLRLSGRDAAAWTAALTAVTAPALSAGVTAALTTTAARAHPLAPGSTLGLWEGRIAGHDVVFHPGDLPGVGTLLLLVPGTGLGLFVHVNGPAADGAWSTLDGLRDARWWIAERLLTRFLGDERVPPTAIDPGLLAEEARVTAGVYRPTRIARTGPEALLTLSGLVQVRVTVEEDGAAIVHTPADASPPRRYLPTAAGAYRRDDGGDVLVASRGPTGTPLLHGSLGLPVTLEAVPPLERGELLVGSVVAALVAAFASLVAWPLGTWRRRRARLPRGTEPGLVIVALRTLARLQAVGVLAWLVLAFLLIDAAQRRLVYDPAAWGPWPAAAWSLLAITSALLGLLAIAAWAAGDAVGSARPRTRPRAALHLLYALAGAALALQGWVWRLPPWG